MKKNTVETTRAIEISQNDIPVKSLESRLPEANAMLGNISKARAIIGNLKCRSFIYSSLNKVLNLSALAAKLVRQFVNANRIIEIN